MPNENSEKELIENLSLEEELNKWDRFEDEMSRTDSSPAFEMDRPYITKTESLKNNRYADVYTHDIGRISTQADIEEAQRLYNNEYIAALMARAETKDSTALNQLGVVYFTLGNMPEASKYFTQAAEAGNIEAKRNLAITMENAESTDLAKIFGLYEEAAKENDAYALNNLGCCYLNGEGTEQNYEKAVECFERAAGLKDDLAFLNLAACYSFGLGTDKNLEKAFELYKQSADLGNNTALKMLANSYYYGRGVKQDTKEALKYYKASEKTGDKDSAKMVEKILKPQQKAAVRDVSDKAKEEQNRQNRQNAENTKKVKERKGYDRNR
ncbi:MAG: sel1 repeat family protein [Clostridiales bacterium]|nr:sel1 repeat family protein [Clostridiales bacterium]